MKKKAVWSIFILLLAGLILLSVGKVGKERRVITLPDGTVVRLAAVTYGTDHVRTPTLAQKVRAWLPFLSDGATRWGDPPIDSSAPTLGLWFDREGGNAMSKSESFLVSGDDGVEARVWGQYIGWGEGLALLFEAFPRDSEMIEVKLVRHGAGTPVVYSASFRFVNPARQRSLPPLVPQPFPASCWDRGVEFQALQLLVSPPSLEDDSCPNSLSYTVNRPGAPDHSWVAKITKISDHQGNMAPAFSDLHEKGKTRFDIGLWPNSPWLIDLIYYKDSNFEPHELGSLTEVPIPASGSIDVQVKDLPINGNLVQVKGGVMLALTESEGMVVALEEVTDDQNRIVKEGGSNAFGDGIRHFYLQPEPDARYLNVRLSLVEKYYASLILQPTLDSSSGNKP